jgi:hypothetical protein
MTATLPKDNTLVPLSLGINTNQEYQQRTRPKGTRVDEIVNVKKYNQNLSCSASQSE